MANTSLYKAKSSKNDEYYTFYEDVAKEAENYKEHFYGKKVFCNCDDPTWSAFWKYFHLNFEKLGLVKLTSTHYDCEQPTYQMVYKGGDDGNIYAGQTIQLKENGDFRSEECINLLKDADIIVTNPPFSLFREYMAQLIEYDKKFLIIGNKNAVINKEFFPLIQSGRVWIGCNNVHKFVTPDGEVKSFGNIGWYTNIDIKKRHEKIPLTKKYEEGVYQKYDNFNAIDVPKVSDIPVDYTGIMGVPITIIEKMCPEQFEIVWQASGNTRACCPENILNDVLQYKRHPEDRGGCGVINGVRQYSRIFIRNKI